MSILIKGMKMPENCLECDLRSFDEYCPFTNVECLNIGRQDSCPLVEIPTPHGRLIDADALREAIKEARKRDPEIEDVYTDDYFIVADWLRSAPTIIESEGTE